MKAEIEKLKKPDECPVPGYEKEWKEFQWLLDASDDDDEEAEIAKAKRLARHRDSKRAAESDDSDVDGDSDLNSVDGQVNAAPGHFRRS